MSNPRYWQRLSEADPKGNDDAPADEFQEELPVEPLTDRVSLSRRNFFKMMGLSSGLAAAACGRAPLQKIIPFAKKPEELTPGLALWYASSCGGCSAGCGLLLKARDGRPIKVEGNAEHPLSRGGVCAVGQASLLSLYDASRAHGPAISGKSTDWATLDGSVRSALERIDAQKSAIRLVLPETIGPSAEAAVERFLLAHPSAKLVRWDPDGIRRAIAEAHRRSHGVMRVPELRFDRARVIVSFDADFLGTWISPVAYAHDYAAGRPIDFRMSRHIQLEPALSLTGSNADLRFPVAPSDLGPALAALVRRLADHARHPEAKAIGAAAAGAPKCELAEAAIEQSANALENAPLGSAMVVAGSAEPRIQLLCNLANTLLGAYGVTVDLEQGIGLDADALSIDAFHDELRAGTVGAAIFIDSNPVHAHPRGAELAPLLDRLALCVSTADRRDETAAHGNHHAPDSTAFESWGDIEPRRGLLGLRQPAVAPLFDTRQAWESLLAWAGEPVRFHDFMKARWEREVFSSAALKSPVSFTEFWDSAVQLGFATLLHDRGAPPSPAARFDAVSAAQAIGEWPAAAGDLELHLIQKVGIRDGRLANNAWLQELPDPITKQSWGNALHLAPARAAALGLRDGQQLTVTRGKQSLSLPLLIQPGLHPRTVAVAIGYGRTAGGSIANGVGANASPLLAGEGPLKLAASAAPPALIALTQLHASMEGRPIIEEASLPAILSPLPKHESAEPPRRSLWRSHPYNGHRWGMAIDLSACNGCSACVISCQAENNVPSVGAEEVSRRHEMHWLRIDRYYEGSPDNPAVLHQPMMCQHCENAPCETVCPVLATVHSSEGLNQQVYNRCVGTRYCANNCPTKVRRFNWFTYRHDDALERMVLNPDVVVRSRGVMEKCSMCGQRIEEAKALARRQGRAPADGEIQTACQQSCPARAIHFGDLNDPKSDVARAAGDRRNYKVLEDLNLGPVVSYLAKIRNDKKSGT